MNTFRKNPLFAAELRRQPSVRLLERARAEAAAAAVRSLTPRGSTGQAARSIEVVEDADGVSLASSDPFWHLIEFGSVNNPAYAPMRRGVRAAGLRLAERQR